MMRWNVVIGGQEISKTGKGLLTYTPTLPGSRGAARGGRRDRCAVRAALDHGAAVSAVVASDTGSMILVVISRLEGPGRQMQ